MILQALNECYGALAKRGEISLPGWCDAKVSYALDIDEQGTLHGLIPLKTSPDGKKEVPRILRVPEQTGRSSNVCPNFLCNNGEYLLGIDYKGKPQRTRQCFDAARALHEELLAAVDSPAARGVRAFFGSWQPDKAEEHPALLPYLDDIKKGANIVLSVDGQYAHEDGATCAAWQAHYAQRSGDAAQGRCLVTGQIAPIARLHPSIKGVRDAQSSGAKLVSFNELSFESYGHNKEYGTGQGLNSPVSEQAAFAYGTALNYLLADREHVQYIGDAAVICWAEDAEPLCQDVFCGSAFGSASERITNNELWSTVKALAGGGTVSVSGVLLRPENHFFVLGLAPSASRLSVRFFLQDTFGSMLSNLLKHYADLEIVKPAYVSHAELPLWNLLSETVRQKKKSNDGKKGDDEKNGTAKASPLMAGAVMRAILTGGMYPASLLNNTLIRIRAEQNVTYGRAAIIQAYYRRLDAPNIPKEVLKVNLDRNTDYMPYLLGRLFAIFEQVQIASSDTKPNTTIKDRFLKSAAVTPDYVFQILIPLNEAHMSKLQRDKAGLAHMFNKEKQQVFSLIKTDFPKLMNTHEQNVFYLGYYKQLNHNYKEEDN